MAESSKERSIEATRRLARLAGAAYVLLSLATAFGFYHAPLLTGNLAGIARAMGKSELHFRIGVVTDVLSAVLAVPLGLLLFELFRPVHKMLALLMASLLIVAVPVSFVVALNYVAAHWLFSGAPEVAAIAGDQRAALGMLFLRLHRHGVLAVEIFWGLWLLPFGALVIRSRFLPRVLGILLIIGGVAYAVHSVVALMLGGQRIVPYEQFTMLARAAAEIPIMLWLVIRGAGARRGKQRVA